LSLVDGILLAAFDFDATILDFHTGGQWEGNKRDLVRHVRPEFKCYISLCLDKGIRVAVVTFSTQTRMIAKVLQEAIPHSRVEDIVVFGGNDFVKGYSDGKQSQLFLAMEHFNKLQAPSRGRVVPITPSVTVLVDDDPENIRVANNDGFKTIQFHPDNPKTLHTSLSFAP
jgi:FMN phosphatase YigB (HAD superfamily)